MIHPSYADLMNVVNSNVEEGEQPVVQSRYSIVLATSKRARQIIAGDEPLIDKTEGVKPLSLAVEELYEGKLRILSEEEAAKKAEEEMAAAKDASEETFNEDGAQDEEESEAEAEEDEN